MQHKHLKRPRLITALLLSVALLTLAATSFAPQSFGLSRPLSAQSDPDFVTDLPKQDFAAAFNVPSTQIQIHRVADITWPANIDPFLPSDDWAALDGDGGGRGSLVWLSSDQTTAGYFVTISGGLTWRVYQNCATCSASTLPAGVTATADLIPITPLPDAPNTLPTTGTGGLIRNDTAADLSIGSVIVAATIIAILAALIVLSVHLVLRRPRLR